MNEWNKSQVSLNEREQALKLLRRMRRRTKEKSKRESEIKGQDTQTNKHDTLARKCTSSGSSLDMGHLALTRVTDVDHFNREEEEATHRWARLGNLSIATTQSGRLIVSADQVPSAANNFTPPSSRNNRDEEWLRMML